MVTTPARDYSHRARRLPQRRCVLCGRRAEQGELTRVVRRPQGGVLVDPSSASGGSGQAPSTFPKSPGRGAYLCRDAEACRDGRAGPALRHRIEHALGVRLGNEEWDRVQEALPGSLEGSSKGKGG